MSAHGGSGPEAPGWTPPAGAAPAYVGPYRSLRGLEPWIYWLLLALGVAYALTAVITLAAHGLGEYSTSTRLDDLSGADLALSVIGLLTSLPAIAIAVLFIIWFYRAYGNLRPLGAPPPRRAVGWTIGAWFVPVLDLILPKLMLNEVWRGSEPGPDGGGGDRASIPAFHHLWWATWVAAFLLSIAVGVESGVSSFDTALSTDAAGATATVNSGLSVLANLLYAVAAVLGALVVRRTTERQEARWRRLAGVQPAAQGAGGWTSA